jgi:Ca2+-binding EF-hand superfamily protein
MGCGGSAQPKPADKYAEAAPETKPAEPAAAASTDWKLEKETAKPDAATAEELKDKADDPPEVQLAKCMGNLEYLRRELLTCPAEKKAELEAEVKARKQTCKKLRGDGVVPAAGVCVFNQIDLMKTRKVDKKGLERLVKSLAAAFKGRDMEPVDDIMKTLDVDQSGDIDITEWCTRITECPKLYAVLCEDLDPDWGKLRSYRNLEDQLAKLLGNLQRLHRELLANQDERALLEFPPLEPERKAGIEKEITQRKDQASKLISKGVRPSPGYVVFAQVDAEKKRKLTRKELERLVKAIGYVFKGREIEGIDKIMNVMDADRSGDIDEAEWVQNLQKLPLLYRVLQEDIDPESGTLLNFRTPEDQLAKCMGNLERLRRELIANQDERKIAGLPELTDERKTEIEKDIRQRKDQCKKYRAMGIVPSPGYVVFNQIDASKNRKLSGDELKRLIKALQYVFKEKEVEAFDDIMKVMDADRSGDIDEFEWVKNLRKVPKLYQILQEDIDPDWGTLRSFRTPEDQLAKCMGNIERLRRELIANQDERKIAGLPVLTDEGKAKIEKEIRQRKDQCKKYRAMGIVPSPGYVVFNQIDASKNRTLSKDELQRLVKALQYVFKDKEVEPFDKIMAVMDADRSGDIDESEWVNNLKKLPLLYKILQADIDPDWGTLKSFRTPEDQLAKCMGNLERLRRELQTDVTDDRKQKIEKDIRQRKDQCKRYRSMGITPSPGYVVFSQIDVGKARQLTTTELQRLLKAIGAVYKDKEIESVEKIMAVMDADRSGAIDEAEWVSNLKKLPMLNKVLSEDIDPDWGTLKSYRTLEDQLAKLFGNIFRLEERIAGGEEGLDTELQERKAQAEKMRSKGVIPSPGIVIFSQLDKNKSRTLDKAELSEALGKIAPGADLDSWFAKIDPEGKGEIAEGQFVLNVKHIPELVAAIMADTDPDTGRMKSL